MFDVIRFYESGRKSLIFDGVSEKEAKEWCNSPLTRKAGVYFDGFSKRGSYKTGKPKYSSYFSPSEMYH